MITPADLQKTALDRLVDAETLLSSNRYDGAAYLCGYSVEIALKHKICLRERWAGFPSTGSEFSGKSHVRTHDLDKLLSLSGAEATLKGSYFSEWSLVSGWRPEVRYNPSGNVTEEDAKDMIDSAKIIINNL
ncbi:HEPN domain-containing protein [Spirosoma pulveris]